VRRVIAAGELSLRTVLTPARSSIQTPVSAGASAPLVPGSVAEHALIWVSRLIGHLLFGAVLLRAILLYAGTSALLPAGLLLGIYLVLYLVFGLVARSAPQYRSVVLLVQVGVVTALLSLPSFPDFVSVLFGALSAQAARHFTPRQVAGWLGLFAVVMLFFLVSRWGLGSGLAAAAVYLAASSIVAIYGVTSQRALAARARNQALSRELQQAAQQLAAYAARQQQWAAARERSRLARELHDSVTQTIFSLTLTAQSALLLAGRDPPRVAAQLDRLETLASGAQGELRALFAHLRPGSADRDGLLAALQQHLAARRSQDGLRVTLEVQAGETPVRLLPAEEASLFRIVQEALNNVVKHAHTGQAQITLCLDEPAWVRVTDNGRGFDARQAPGAGHLGLASLRARAEEIGWRLSVTSAPGSGTCVRAEKVCQEDPP
jgi:signal transduction histidine kinase